MIKKVGEVILVGLSVLVIIKQQKKHDALQHGINDEEK